MLQVFLRLVALKRLGVLFFVLAATLCATSTASALEPSQTKTRVWDFGFAEHNSGGLSNAATSGKHQGNRLALSELASGSLLAAEGTGETVSLFRAVGDAELRVIESSGGRIPASLSGLESKYFSATAEGASSYARQAVRGFGDAPYTLVESQISRSSLPADVLLQVDRNVPAVVLPNGYLGQLGPARIWSYMPVPR